MKITAIVLSYNSQDYISACLKSLQALEGVSPHQLEIAVIDNDSSDGTLEVVRKNFPSIKLIRNPSNMGYAGGNNTGLIYALDTGSDFAWLINPDLVVSKDCLAQLLSGATRHVNGAIFAPKIYFAPGEEFHPERYSKEDLGKVIWSAGGLIDWANLIAYHRGVNEVDKSQFDYDVEIDYVPGTCMFIKRRVLEKAGLLDPRYFLYFEENDLCQRSKRLGYKNMFINSSTAWHANAKSSGLGVKENTDLQDYYIARNRLFFSIKYAPIWTKQACLREALRIYKHGRPWQKRGVIDFFTGRLGAGSFQPE